MKRRRRRRREIKNHMHRELALSKNVYQKRRAFRVEVCAEFFMWNYEAGNCLLINVRGSQLDSLDHQAEMFCSPISPIPCGESNGIRYCSIFDDDLKGKWNNSEREKKNNPKTNDITIPTQKSIKKGRLASMATEWKVLLQKRTNARRLKMKWKKQVEKETLRYWYTYFFF